MIRFARDPETIHKIALAGLRLLGEVKFLNSPLYNIFSVRSQRLEKELWGIKFPNPVGLAAGFDKNALALKGLSALGFGFIEIGTITKYPQTGYPRPRIFKLSREKALINRMGFPNDGAEIISQRLERLGKLSVPLGINIGKSVMTPIHKAADEYIWLLTKFYNLADYFVVNISSPNSPGLIDLQAKDKFKDLALSLSDASRFLSDELNVKRKPILVKISPDLNLRQLNEFIAVCLDYSIDGIVATNTASIKFPYQGGLSGRPLFQKALETVEYISKLSSRKLPIIGCGGILGIQEAKHMFAAGASLIQVYTGLVYKGPLIVRDINRNLLRA